MLWLYVLIGLISLLLGFWLGGQHGRRVKRESLAELNTKSLEMLEIKNQVKAIKVEAAEVERKDRLLSLSLKELQESKAQLKKMRQLMITQGKKQFIDESYLRLKAIKSHEKALKATELARKATSQLKRWESAIPAIQALQQASETQPQKSTYPTVDVLDNRRVNGSSDVVRRVSSRDSRRLAKLNSSNEASGPINWPK